MERQQNQNRIHNKICWLSTYLGIKDADKTALSTTESEFIALSEGLGNKIQILNLMEELQEQGVSIMNSNAEINCKVFEDNLGALTIATLPKIRPRTKYINTKY